MEIHHITTIDYQEIHPSYWQEIKARGDDPRVASMTSTKVRLAGPRDESMPHFIPIRGCRVKLCVEKSIILRGAEVTRPNPSRLKGA